MLTIYEITLRVRADLTDRFEEFMRDRHIPDLIATGFFASARFAKRGDRYRVWYETSDLAGYLAADAERLRADFIRHFPEGVEAARESWELVGVWDANAAD